MTVRELSTGTRFKLHPHGGVFEMFEYIPEHGLYECYSECADDCRYFSGDTLVSKVFKGRHRPQTSGDVGTPPATPPALIVLR